MAAPVRADYLKKYLSGDGEEKKKKKRRKIIGPVAKIQKSRIVDDDVDFKSLLPENLSNTLEDDVGDNDPVIADFVDERPEHIKVLEKYRSSGAWKLMGKKDEQEVNTDQVTTSRHDSDSDQSLPRKQNDSKQNSANNGNAVSEQTSRQKLNSKSEHSSNRKKDSDHSLPSRKQHSLGSDDTSQRKQRHDSDNDHSPPRRQRHDSDNDNNPPRRQRHNLDSDHSPMRRLRHDSDNDNYPPRRQRHESDSDHSPLRKQRHDFDSDYSAPRRKRANSDSDQSPPRREKHNLNSNQPPLPSKEAQNNSDSLSTKRLRHDSNIDSDQSPPRKSVKRSKDSSPKWQESDTNSVHSSSKQQYSQDIGQPGQTSHRQAGSKHRNDMEDKTLAGKKAGLSSSNDMRIEADILRQKEEEHFKQISDERLGKGSATVFRDKFGKKRDLAEEKKQESENAKQKAKEEEKFQKWGKGLKQREDQSKNVEEALQEALKPLARYKNDEDLDKMLRDMDRAEDPMLAFIKKKKNKNNNLQEKAEKPHYKGPAPLPNRFGIMPGYRWDGVDRSNGFEKQIYAKQAESKAKTEQAYKWSVEDM